MSASTNVLCRDPYGSRGSKYHLAESKTLLDIVEILMDLVDLNQRLDTLQDLPQRVEILMDLVDLNPCMERQLFRR